MRSVVLFIRWMAALAAAFGVAFVVQPPVMDLADGLRPSLGRDVAMLPVFLTPFLAAGVAQAILNWDRWRPSSLLLSFVTLVAAFILGPFGAGHMQFTNSRTASFLAAMLLGAFLPYVVALYTARRPRAR